MPTHHTRRRTGHRPDTFKDEAEVVLKGSSTPEGFHCRTDGVMAKCPSKYEAAQEGQAKPWPPSASFLLLATFVVCSYAAVASVVGARRRSRRLIESGIGAFYLVTALMTCASAVIINAFLTDDFSIKYVAHYSDSVAAALLQDHAYWGGLDGSIMFWVFLLSVFGTRRGLREPRAPPRADSLRRRRRSPSCRCSSST